MCPTIKIASLNLINFLCIWSVFLVTDISNVPSIFEWTSLLLPQEYLEKEPGGPITDEDIKEFFSDVKKSVIESALCEQP